MDQRTISLPASLAKNNSAHSFPFGDITRDVIDAIPATSDFLFPARTGTSFYDGHNKAKGKFDATCPLPHWTLHDIRRTFSTIHARIGTPIDVQETLLNHKSGSRSSIQRVYDRYDRMEPMRIAMKNYEEQLRKIFAEHSNTCAPAHEMAQS